LCTRSRTVAYSLRIVASGPDLGRPEPLDLGDQALLGAAFMLNNLLSLM